MQHPRGSALGPHKADAGLHLGGAHGPAFGAAATGLGLGQVVVARKLARGTQGLGLAAQLLGREELAQARAAAIDPQLVALDDAFAADCDDVGRGHHVAHAAPPWCDAEWVSDLKV